MQLLCVNSPAASFYQTNPSASKKTQKNHLRRGAMAKDDPQAAASAPPFFPITTSAVLMTASKHLTHACRSENKAFLDCKRGDPDPEKCLHRGLDVTRCTLSILKELHDKCPKEMDAFAKCMDYYGNEFKLCRKQQQEFEGACPLKV